MIGISADRPEKLLRFAGKHRISYPLLSDTGGKVLESYGVRREVRLLGRGFGWTRRASYLIDPNGIIRKAYPRVRVGTHAREVARDRAAL